MNAPLPPPTPRWGRLFVYLAVLAALFHGTLRELAAIVRPSPLFSYIPLVPLVTIYLLWERRRQLAVAPPAWGIAALLAAAGLAFVALGRALPAEALLQDRAAAGMAALVLLALAGVALTGGRALLRTGFVPWLLLLFAIPLPQAAETALETLLQVASAEAAAALFALTPMPVLRDGLNFHLPRLNLAVAPECSGINATWVLLMCSLIAGTLLLRTPWRRAVLVAIVLPLGILRNAVRIVSLGLLTVYVDPGIIDSPLHHRGGPIFFALSFAVFLAILAGLWRGERRRNKEATYAAT